MLPWSLDAAREKPCACGIREQITATHLAGPRAATVRPRGTSHRRYSSAMVEIDEFFAMMMITTTISVTDAKPQPLSATARTPIGTRLARRQATRRTDRRRLRLVLPAVISRIPLRRAICLIAVWPLQVRILGSFPTRRRRQSPVGAIPGAGSLKWSRIEKQRERETRPWDYSKGPS